MAAEDDKIQADLAGLKADIATEEAAEAATLAAMTSDRDAQKALVAQRDATLAAHGMNPDGTPIVTPPTTSTLVLDIQTPTVAIDYITETLNGVTTVTETDVLLASGRLTATVVPQVGTGAGQSGGGDLYWPVAAVVTLAGIAHGAVVAVHGATDLHHGGGRWNLDGGAWTTFSSQSAVRVGDVVIVSTGPVVPPIDPPIVVPGFWRVIKGTNGVMGKLVDSTGKKVVAIGHNTYEITGDRGVPVTTASKAAWWADHRQDGTGACRVFFDRHQSSGGTNLVWLDDFVAGATAANVSVVLALGDCANKAFDTSWANAGFPAGADRTQYLAHAAAIFAKYGKNPAIKIIELFNEPNVNQALYDLLTAVAAAKTTAGAQQLLAYGNMAFYSSANTAAGKTEMIRLHKHPSLDLVGTHEYDGVADMSGWDADVLAVAAGAGLAAYKGECGAQQSKSGTGSASSNGEPCKTPAAAATMMQGKITKTLTGGFSLVLVWSWRYDQTVANTSTPYVGPGYDYPHQGWASPHPMIQTMKTMTLPVPV